MMRLAALTLISSLLFARAAEAACRSETLASGDYVICQFDPAKDDIRVFLNDAGGAPFGDFDAVTAKVAANGETLVFAMNAGMYHKDRSPVGLYIENGQEKKPLSTRDGPGNFHLKPNGVFWIDGTGAAYVTPTDEYAVTVIPGQCVVSGQESSSGVARPWLPGSQPSAAPRNDGNCKSISVRHATQSGPLLVIDGAIHPKFLVDATSRKRRNGVGVTPDGAVVFALADTPVTFREFAAAFRDEMKTPNALYLDGTISRLFAPELDRNDGGPTMGPIVGVVKK